MPLFDGLSDYEAGRCADCRAHRGAPGCRKCEYEHSTDAYHPPITGAADRSYLTRLDADKPPERAA